MLFNKKIRKFIFGASSAVLAGFLILPFTLSLDYSNKSEKIKTDSSSVMSLSEIKKGAKLVSGGGNNSNGLLIPNNKNQPDSYDLFVWGKNENGQLGIHDQTNNQFPIWSAPRKIDFIKETTKETVLDFSISSQSSVALIRDEKGFKHVYTAGNREMIGRKSNSENPASIFSEIPFLYGKDIIDVEAGAQGTSMAVVKEGSTYSIFSWGNNKNGICGLGFESNIIKEPKRVNKLFTKIVSLSIGVNSANAIGSLSGTNETNKLFRWGDNTNNKLGLDSKLSNKSTINEPTEMKNKLFSNKKIIEIDEGENHTFIRTLEELTNKEVDYVHGDNQFGQLGLSSFDTSTDWGTLKTFSALNNIDSINLDGQFSSAIIDENQTKKLYMWGRNDQGQLGLGSIQDQNTPKQLINPMMNGLDLVNISLGNDSAVILLENSNSYKLLTWGSNKFNQLGFEQPTGDDKCLNPKQINKTINTKVIQIDNKDLMKQTLCFDLYDKLTNVETQKEYLKLDGSLNSYNQETKIIIDSPEKWIWDWTPNNESVKIGYKLENYFESGKFIPTPLSKEMPRLEFKNFVIPEETNFNFRDNEQEPSQIFKIKNFLLPLGVTPTQMANERQDELTKYITDNLDRLFVSVSFNNSKKESKVWKVIPKLDQVSDAFNLIPVTIILEGYVEKEQIYNGQEETKWKTDTKAFDAEFVDVKYRPLNDTSKQKSPFSDQIPFATITTISVLALIVIIGLLLGRFLRI